MTKRGQDDSRFNDRVGIDEKNSSPSRFSFARIYVRLTICSDSIRRRMTAAKKGDDKRVACANKTDETDIPSSVIPVSFERDGDSKALTTTFKNIENV